MIKNQTARVVGAFVSLALLSANVFSQGNPILEKAVTDELNRNFSIFKEKGDIAPYFMSYRVNDGNQVSIQAMNGAIVDVSDSHTRLLAPDLRIGTYELDSTHLSNGISRSPIGLPIDNDYDAIRSVIWDPMNDLYTTSLESLRRAKQLSETTVKDEFESPDFSKEPVVTFTGKNAKIKVDRAEWEKKIRDLSGILKKYPYIFLSTVGMTVEASNQFYVDTDGSRLSHGYSRTRISATALARADDGMILSKSTLITTLSPESLPDYETLAASVEQTAKDLMALREAKTMEPFTGPAVLSGRASGVFFHEIFGHRMEGLRLKSDSDGNTFTAKLGQSVLPTNFSVVDDPTVKAFNGVDLNGHYPYDDEGVKSERVELVKDGILKTFLMSRSPVPGVAKSNGHGRAQPGYSPVSRQGNLIVNAKEKVSTKMLRQKLIEEIKRQNKPFGLFFDDISGGFTATSRYATQSFQVTPVMVYKVYADGRPDELVRGLDMIGTPLTVFSKIIAADDKPEIFNGMCGAESGWVPVSAISPGILVSQIEVQKRAKSNDSQPVLPPPGVDPSMWKGGNGE